MHLPRYNIAIFASGSGSNAEAIIRHFKHHDAIRVTLVLTNNPEAQVITRAESHGVATHTFTKQEFVEGTVHHLLQKHQITHLVLAGFLWLVPQSLVQAYAGTIINIHPALLPAFGGKGMYGMRVHEAVKDAGVTKSGITIHLVNEQYDEGAVVRQVECAIESNDSSHDIAAKVQALEHQYYPITIEQWIKGSAV